MGEELEDQKCNTCLEKIYKDQLKDSLCCKLCNEYYCIKCLGERSIGVVLNKKNSKDKDDIIPYRLLTNDAKHTLFCYVKKLSLFDDE